MTDSFKNGVIAEIECTWESNEFKEGCDNDLYNFVDYGEYEKQAFWDWYWNEESMPDIEDVIENANRIQMIRDAYLEIIDCASCPFEENITVVKGV